ncbi:ABC transporter permease subunit [Chitinimonas sp. PSY-7]|uniref:ABC transporter permease subunit n=1 Tax=Chitinimonas sp. PSY-7 TaxID=3459088 RepID=UPI00403FF346
MYTHFFSTWLAGVRSRSLRVVGGVAICLVLLAYLAGTFSGRHPQTVALDVGISGVRLTMAMLALFWTQELVAHELTKRTVLFSLSYPSPRWTYLIGRYLGIVALLLVSVLLLGGAIYGMVAISGVGYRQVFNVHFGGDFVFVCLGIGLDAMVISAFSLLLSTLATSSLLPLVAGVGFTFIARGYGTVLALVQDPNGGYADQASFYMPILEFFGYIVPNLGALDFRDSILYSVPLSSQSWIGIVHASMYVIVLLVIALQIFERREFN